MAEARERGVKIILTLGNHWSNFGGIQRYYEWFNSRPIPAGVRVERERPTDDEARFFYTDRRARQAYRDHARSILRRVNSITGIAYFEDPTILAVELLNEPRTTEGYADDQLDWMIAMSRYIRTLAPYHLIGTGVDTAFVRNELSVRQWQRLGDLRDIDYFDMHLYPGSSHSPDSPQDMSELLERFREAANYAHEVAGKPIVIGEIGFTQDTAAYFQRDVEARHKNRQELLLQAIQAAVRTHDIDGALFWLFRPHPNPAQDSHHIHPDIPEDQAFLRGIRRLRTQLPNGSR
jgi:mannan endo-1,4-beta-mannosidase